MNNKEKSLQFYQMLVDEWIFVHMCPSPVVNNIASGLTGDQFYNKRGAQEVKYPHSNHQQATQQFLLFVVQL